MPFGRLTPGTKARRTHNENKLQNKERRARECAAFFADAAAEAAVDLFGVFPDKICQEKLKNQWLCQCILRGR